MKSVEQGVDWTLSLVDPELTFGQLEWFLQRPSKRVRNTARVYLHHALSLLRWSTRKHKAHAVAREVPNGVTATFGRKVAHSSKQFVEPSFLERNQCLHSTMLFSIPSLKT
jgi:hypothetical protein